MIKAILTIIYIYIKISCQQQHYEEDDDDHIFFSDWEIFYSPMDLLPPKYVTTINNCSYRINPNVITICSGVQCKRIPNGFNVTTPLFKIQLSSVERISAGDFKNLHNLEALEIEGNMRLTYLEPQCFKYMKNLRNLTITSNLNLMHLERDVFNGLVNLQILCLSKNGFKFLSDITIACAPHFVPKLKLLDIAEHTFHQVLEEDFYTMNGTNVKQLNLILCQIKYIHPNCLAPLKNLRALRLCQNLFNRTIITDLIIRTLELGIKLQTLNLYQVGLRHSPFVMLEALAKSDLSYIILSGNTFNNIFNNFFPLMPNLTCLDLRRCMIMTIEIDAFVNLTNLHYLQLDGNKLSEFPYALTTIKNLEILYLDSGGNSNDGISSFIMNIPEKIFTNMSGIMYLRISNNWVESVSKTMFAHTFQLLKLNLKSTSLSFIENGAFNRTPDLMYLNLINNPELSKMPLTSEVFLGLNNLQILLLGGCLLQNLTSTPSIFTHMNNLTHLGLEGNDLLVINSNQLNHLNSLEVLELSDNKLASWNKLILPRPNLKVLNVNQNKFSFLTTTMLDDCKYLKVLNLEGNPLFCDCSLYTIVKWFQANRILITKDKLDNFVAHCVTPEKWRDKSIVEFLEDLGKNGEYICEHYVSYTTLIICSSVISIMLLTCIITLFFIRWHIRYWKFLFRLSFMKHNPWKQHRKQKKSASIDCLGNRYDAFISYSKEDRLFVLQAVTELEGKEPFLKLCIYERDFEIGAPISRAILESVATSRRTVLIVSNAFTRSQWCRWEMQLAEYHQLFFRDDNSNGPDDALLIIKLEKLEKKHLTPTLKYLLKTRIYLEWDSNNVDNQREFWRKLKLSLALPKGHIKTLNQI